MIALLARIVFVLYLREQLVPVDAEASSDPHYHYRSLINGHTPH